MKKKIWIFALVFLLIPTIVKAEVNPLVTILDNTGKIITEGTNTNITENTNVFCGQNTYIPYKFVDVVRTVIDIIKIGIPVLLIIFGMLDLGKAVVASKQDDIKKNQKNFVSRLIMAMAVFFVISIVQLALSVVSADDEILSCLKCIVKDDACKYVEIEYETPTPTSTPTPTPNPTKTPQPTETPEIETNSETTTEEIDTSDIE
jgi:Predicted solute binding protein